MVAAISSINPCIDPEYLRIIQQLRSLGIAPSGNKTVDQAKLAQAKAELIEKIHTKHEEEIKSELQVQPIADVEDVVDTKRAEMEEKRLGAMNVAELNKLFFGL